MLGPVYNIWLEWHSTTNMCASTGRNNFRSSLCQDFSEAILWTVTVLPVFARVMRRLVVRVTVEDIARTTESGAEGSVNYLSVVADSACDLVTDTEQQQSFYIIYFTPKSFNLNSIYAYFIKNKYSWRMSSYNEIVSNPRSKNEQTKEGKHENLCK